MDLPAPSTNSNASRTFRSPYRRRRIVWFAVLLTIAGLFFLAPSSFWETGHGHTLVEVGKAWIPSKSIDVKSYTPAEELRDLLHMVASSELRIPPNVDPSKPLDRKVYGGNFKNVAWLQEPQADTPIIVFSKTYCPYSKKAKELLGTYDLSPSPKVVEVDLRDDADLIKAILTRLTGHSTFPNIFIEGQSIGGSDNLAGLHADGRLIKLLTDAGISSNADVESLEKE
ncbi:thioredoxin-like protein [Phellopilus nigrolimitatus]|nr:thioredoxin-like protein [Phellopilus nigrolimitatus]